MEEHFRKKLKDHKVDWDKEELLGGLKQELSQNKSKFNWRLLLLLPLLFIATCWGLTENEVASENRTVSIYHSTEKNITKETTIIASNSNANKTSRVVSNHEEDKFSFLIKTNDSKSFSNSNFTANELITENPISQDLSLATKDKKQKNDSKSPSSPIIDNTAHQIISADSERFNFFKPLPQLKISRIPFEERTQSKLPESTYSFESILKKETSRFKNSFFMSSSIEVGAIIHQNTNYATNDLEFLQLLINNEKTESSRVLLSTNFSIGYLNQSGWSIQSGIEYNEVMGFFNYKHVETDTIPAFNESAFYLLNQNMDTLFFGDTTLIVRTEERLIRHWNKQPYLSIPLEIGYRYPVGKANIFGTIGINYAFAYKFKGRVNQLNEDGTNEIIDNPKFILKSRFGYKLSVGTEIPIFKRTHLLMNLSYRRNPKLAGESKEQFYRSFSSGVGLRVSLN